MLIKFIVAGTIVLMNATSYPLYDTEFMVVTSYYIPSRGGINCDSDCTTMATGKISEDMYGNVGACPVDMLGYKLTITGKKFTCRDTGGAIKLRYDRLPYPPYNSVVAIPFDILAHEVGDWNQYYHTLIIGHEN